MATTPATATRLAASAAAEAGRGRTRRRARPTQWQATCTGSVLDRLLATFLLATVLLAIGLLAGLSSCGAIAPHDQLPATTPDDTASRFELFVLGVTQDGGLPHLGCDRPCCENARAEGRRGYPASLGVHDRETGKLVLFEATPSVEDQVALLQRLAGTAPRGRKPIDALVLTHAHIGHYLGLAHFGREVAGTRGLEVHLSPRFATYLRGHGPWRQLVELGQIQLREFAVDATGGFEPIEGLRVQPIAVPHRDEFSDTMAFVIRGPERSVLFVPDVDKWDAVPGLLDKLLGGPGHGVDVALLDGTFYDGRELPGRPIEEVPHPPMVDTMARLADRAAARPGSIRFIHLNHSNPALTDPAMRAEIRGRGFELAERGDRIGL